MVRAPSIDENGLKKGAWSDEEDNRLRAYVQRYGHWNWRQLPKYAGLNRCGKSCRLRWMNYLKPGVRRGNYTPQEEELILKLHKEFGNKWSVIAAKLPGRTDNDIKNHWHTHLRRRMRKDPKSTHHHDEEFAFKEEETSSSSISSIDSEQRNADQDQIETYNDNNNFAQASSYSEVSTLSYDSTLFDSLSSVDSMIMEPFEESSFWTQPFTTDVASYDNNDDINNNVLHQQFPAALEEELMRPFSPYLDEINADWLYEMMNPRK